MARNIKVDLKERSYTIQIGSNLFSKIKKTIEQLGKTRVVIITDTNVAPLYSKELLASLKEFDTDLLIVPGGEQNKTLAEAAKIFDELIDLKINRDAVIIALGGGVIGDIAGFVAATYLRGIDIIQVPTTLLAMVDASIGGKTAVDHSKGKNLIGAFHQPKAVIIDINTLKTLPKSELKNGLAEVIKYGVIKNPEIIAMLEGNPKADISFWEKIIFLCASIKAEVVSKDEKETTGLRMILNFGHTIGHAIENVGGYQKYSHGEAVALGMLAAAKIAKNKKVEDTLFALFNNIGLPTKCIKLKTDVLLQTMKLDKKAKNGKIVFVLPIKLGAVKVVDSVTEAEVRRAFKDLGCN